MKYSMQVIGVLANAQSANAAHDDLSRAAIRANWILISAGAAVLLVAAAVTGFHWDARSLAPLVGLNASLVGLSLVLRKRGFFSLAHLFQAIPQLAYCSMVGSLLSVVLASTDAPMRDAVLIELDRWLGFDWRAAIRASTEWPRLVTLLNYAYASLAYQPLPLLLLLALSGRIARANLLALAWTLTLAITVAVFPFMPALGGYLHHGIGRMEVPEVLVPAAWLYVGVFEGARSGAVRLLGSGTLDGVITFPSFHAAAAVLLAWAWYGIPWLRWTGVALNVVMIASTPVIGGHYLVDTMAGMAVAALGIALARRIVYGPLANADVTSATRPTLAPRLYRGGSPIANAPAPRLREE